MAAAQRTTHPDTGSNVTMPRPALRVAGPGDARPRPRFPRLARLWQRLTHEAIRASVPPTARVFIGIFAVGWTIITVAFWNTAVLIPRAWPAWYVATAVSCWVFFVKPANHWAYIMSGAFSTVGILARAGGVLGDMLWDSSHVGANIYRSAWYPTAEIVVCVLFAASVLFVWHVGFGALHRHISTRCPQCARDRER